MADKPLYRIRRWQENFETAESRRLGKLNWVAVPNKHDGKSFRRLARMEEAGSIYGAWQLILQIASKMPVRGTLCDDDGPLGADDMEDKTGFPEALFQEALGLLTSERIRWIEVVEEAEALGIVGNIQQSLFAPGKNKRSAGRDQPAPAAPSAAQQPAESAQQRPAPPSSAQQNGASPSNLTQTNGHTQRQPGDTQPPAGRAQPSRARAGEHDRTEQDRTQPHSSPGGSPSVGDEEVIARLAPLFDQNPARVRGDTVMRALVAISPMPAEELEIVAWFYGLPADEKAHELRTRHTKLRTLFEGWGDAVGVARAFAKKEGAVFGPEKKEGPEPEGWRERLLEKYPDAELPDAYRDLPPSLKKEVAGLLAAVEAAAA